MSLLNGNALQIGNSGTATQNATLIANGDGTFTLARGNVGATTDDLFTIDASGNVLFPSDTNLLGQSFVSTEQTITAAGALTIPHGLGSSPSLIQSRLICKTAEAGFSIGDELMISGSGEAESGANNYGITVVPDAANINIRYGATAAVFFINNKATGVTVIITPANWKLIVRAWK